MNGIHDIHIDSGENASWQQAHRTRTIHSRREAFLFFAKSRPAKVYARSLQSRLLVSARDLQNRTRVMMSPVHEPEQHTENHDPTVHQDAVIHVLDVWVCRRRPHGEESSEQGIQYRYDGDWNTEPSEPERAPGDLGFRGP